MAFKDLEGQIRTLQLRMADFFARLQLAQPAGAISAYAGAAAPEGWLLCDGRAVNRSDYPALFAAIGTAYGPGNGSSTFNLPDARGRVLVSRDPAQTEFDVLGEAGGAKRHTLTAAEMPVHAHQQRFASNAIAAGGGAAVGGLTGAGGVGMTNAQQTTLNAGSGAAHNNLQPYLTVNYLIKT